MATVNKATLKGHIRLFGNVMSLDWTISKESAKRKSSFKSKVIACHRVEGLSYYLKFFPNQNGNAVIAFKFINPIKEVISYETTFTIKSCGFEKELNGEYERDFIRKIGKTLPVKYEIILCSTQDLFDDSKRFFNEHDELIISLRGMIYTYGISDFELARWTFKSGRKSREPYHRVSYDKDIELIAKNGSVHVHRWVLATKTKFFNDLYTPDEQVDVTQFEMKDFDVSIVQMAVILCYDQTKLDKPPTFEEKLELLKFLDRYPMQKYKAELEEHMLSLINEVTVCLIAQAAIEAHSSKLKKKCAKYIKICAQNKTALFHLNLLDERFRLKVLKTLFIHETRTY